MQLLRIFSNTNIEIFFCGKHLDTLEFVRYCVLILLQQLITLWWLFDILPWVQIPTPGLDTPRNLCPVRSINQLNYLDLSRYHVPCVFVIVLNWCILIGFPFSLTHWQGPSQEISTYDDFGQMFAVQELFSVCEKLGKFRFWVTKQKEAKTIKEVKRYKLLRFQSK